MNNVNEYLSQNLLHVRPLSERLYCGISYASARVTANISHETWHGRAVENITKVFVCVGLVANIFITTAEAIGAFSATFFLTFGFVATKCKSPFFQKHAVKAAGYWFNVLALQMSQIWLIYMRFFSSVGYSFTVTGSQARLLGSAALSQLTLGAICNYLRDSNVPNQAPQQALRVLQENGEAALLTTVNALNDDFPFMSLGSLRSQLLQGNAYQNFIHEYPVHENVINEFSLANLSNDAYRARVRAMFIDFARFSSIGQWLVDEPNVIILQTHSEQEMAYQNLLKGHIKAAFLQIYNSDRLVSCLNENGSIVEGREALTNFYAEVYVPLANFAALLEVKGESVASQSERQEILDKARQKLTTLPPSEMPMLETKIMQGASFVYRADVEVATEERINELYKLIGILGNELHQGKLMSCPTFDASTMHPSSINLFQKACQEAAASIE